MAKQKNASCIAQPNLSISYSLIMRHEGSYSGFRTCKTASNTKNNAAAPNVIRAAVTEIAIADLSGLDVVLVTPGVQSPRLLGDVYARDSGYHLVMTHSVIVFDHHLLHLFWHDRSFRLSPRQLLDRFDRFPVRHDQEFNAVLHLTPQN